MRTHGWGGTPPASDDEAIARILAATRECIDRNGPSTTLRDVADALHVTRQTVYRYFGSTEDLLQATALDAVGEFMERLASRVAGIEEPGSIVIEMVALTLEQLPTEPYIGLLVSSERVGTFARGITSNTAMMFGRSLFARVDIDWSSLGLSGTIFDEFLEHVLRMIQSLVLDPGPHRNGRDLREYLARWLWAPVLRLGAETVGASRSGN